MQHNRHDKCADKFGWCKRKHGEYASVFTLDTNRDVMVSFLRKGTTSAAMSVFQLIAKDGDAR